MVFPKDPVPPVIKTVFPVGSNFSFIAFSMDGNYVTLHFRLRPKMSCILVFAAFNSKNHWQVSGLSDSKVFTHIS